MHSNRHQYGPSQLKRSSPTGDRRAADVWLMMLTAGRAGPDKLYSVFVSGIEMKNRDRVPEGSCLCPGGTQRLCCQRVSNWVSVFRCDSPLMTRDSIFVFLR